MFSDKRVNILLAVTVVAIAVIMSIGPVAQDPVYHRFADSRAFANVANFYNVLSNIPFLVVGYLGMRLVWRYRLSPAFGALSAIYLAFFAGVLLTGIGSGYYHWQPTNASLVWDRMPMTVAFMAFFSAVAGEYIAPRLALQLFGPLLGLGGFSVLYWQVTEWAGHGDLRLYIIVQFLPVLLLPLILYFYRTPSKSTTYVWRIIGVYAAAKVCEFFDAGIYAYFGLLSGHSLKHLLAAWGTYIFYCFIRSKIACYR